MSEEIKVSKLFLIWSVPLVYFTNLLKTTRIYCYVIRHNNKKKTFSALFKNLFGNMLCATKMCSCCLYERKFKEYTNVLGEVIKQKL
jgi:hypothetical protein